MYKFISFNFTALFALFYAEALGYLKPLLESDSTHLVALIFTVFFATLSHSMWLMVKFGLNVDDSRVFSPVARQQNPAETVTTLAARLKIDKHLVVARYGANTLVGLGLIGTVIGIAIALSGVDAARAGDVTAIGPMVATLMEGVRIALYTTLVGAVTNIWATVNFHMVANRARQSLIDALEA